MQKGLTCNLDRCFLCKACVPEWKEAVALHKKTLGFKKGAKIFSEGDPVKGMYFLYSGTVKVHKHWGGQKELIIRFARPGDILGLRGFGVKDQYPVSATALEPVHACFTDTAFFLSSLKVNPDLSLKLNLVFAKELQDAEERMRNLAHMDTRGRVADLLVKLEAQFGQAKNGYLNIVLSRQDIASYAGTTYETVFRVMQEMLDNGWIKVSGKQVKLVDLKALQKISRSASR